MDERENSITCVWAQAPDLPAVLALLKTGNLPTEGVDTILPTMLVAREGERLIGCAGLEVYEMVALLRSVAVHPTYRSQHLGQQLVQALLDHARSLCVHEVYLLTETASEYFPRFGFHLTDRFTVAPAIQRSVEWTSVCPVSAQAMVLHLDVA